MMSRVLVLGNGMAKRGWVFGDGEEGGGRMQGTELSPCPSNMARLWDWRPDSGCSSR